MIRAVGCARDALDRLKAIRAQCVAIPSASPSIWQAHSLPQISPQIKALENRRQRFSIDPSATAIGHLSIILA